MIQVNSEKSFDELYSYCTQYGSLIGAYHFQIKHEENFHYILLEYSNEEEANIALSSSIYNPKHCGALVRSPFLWFKAAKTSQILRNSMGSDKIDLYTINGAYEHECLDTLLSNAQNIDDQIKILFEKTQLNDLGTRIRFIAAWQIEQALSGIFPEVCAQPFGSSVNGLGKMNCDLDLILRFNEKPLSGEKISESNDSRLVFHTKENLINGRSHTQRQMETIADILQQFLPGISHVRRILQARVPIIKYHHEYLNLEVDLSISNL